VSFGQLLKLANQFRLSRKAYSLFEDNGSKVTQAIKPVIAKHTWTCRIRLLHFLR
jgi:hypothetical protein